MKVSKDLLKAIAVGVTIGAGVSSCTLFEDLIPRDQEVCTEECAKDCKVHDSKCAQYDCPACGLG